MGGTLKSKSGMMLYHLFGILLVFGEILILKPPLSSHIEDAHNG